MADPHAVPLPPSRGSLDSNRGGGEYVHQQLSHASHLDPLTEQDSLETTIENGAHEEAEQVQTGEEDERIRTLEDELERTRQDRDAWEQQYQSLMAKLTTMRQTVGDKIQQDADELDRREQEIADLRAANDDLAMTIETLKTELIQSNEDADAAHSELEQLRSHAFDSEKQTNEEANERDLLLREVQEDLERVRIEREEWESEAMRERVRREEMQQLFGQVEMELATAKTERENLREERDREQESAANLHAVLEEFQAAKDRELQSLLGDLQNQLHDATESLAYYRQQAAEAENRLSAAENNSEKLLALSSEVKEKNLLIGKLRHEAVILNEHLTEALRRLKRDSSADSVDRRLVSNVLITFLNTPRGDTKRFEMLQLIASILSWTDDQREKVGLQRSSGGLSGPGVIASGSRGGSKGHARSGKTQAVDEGVENESFSNLWIEFLLKESSQGASSTSAATSSSSKQAPTSPSSEFGSGQTSPFGGRFDLPSLGSPPRSTTSTRRPSLTSIFSNGSSTAQTSTAPPSIAEEEK
ncbi:uncharacterized protein JCM6883_003101 [Sporobolomyces salmoneus]|uniref:uncharacterized protein n=1 Tax=Sporobolomyces salmoneus TaxID=183962 RepID=UPI003172BE93